jgi:hypothetical protein
LSTRIIPFSLSIILECTCHSTRCGFVLRNFIDIVDSLLDCVVLPAQRSPGIPKLRTKIDACTFAVRFHSVWSATLMARFVCVSHNRKLYLGPTMTSNFYVNFRLLTHIWLLGLVYKFLLPLSIWRVCPLQTLMILLFSRRAQERSDQQEVA